MFVSLANFAKEKNIKYFLVSYTDLFGYQRAKLVPAHAISDMEEKVQGLGFASWLDLSPADEDMLAVPDGGSVIQLLEKRLLG